MKEESKSEGQLPGEIGCAAARLPARSPEGQDSPALRKPAALREPEEGYRAIFETTGAGTIIVENDMTVSLVNTEFERLSGYSREEVEGKKRWTEFFLAEDLERMKEHHRLVRVAPGEPPRSYETRFRTQSGEVLDILITMGTIRGTLRTVISFLDITERKRMEEAVFRLAEENAALVEIGRIISSSLNIEEVYEGFVQEARKLVPFDRISINLIDPQGATLTHAYVSGSDIPGRKKGQVSPLQGSAADHLLRARSSLWLREENRQELKERFPGLRPLLDFGFRSMVLVPLFSKERPVGVLNFASLQADAYFPSHLITAEGIGAQIAGAIANARLFSQVSQAEERLRLSEEKYRGVVENANEAIFIIQDESIKFPNPRALSLWGYSAEELASMSLASLIHPDDRERAVDRLQSRGRGESLEPLSSFRGRTKTGEEIWMEFTSVPIPWEGRPATMHFVRDVTREKKLEVQFQTAQKMEAIGTLAGGIAHDFNNLLMAIQGHVSILLLDMLPGHPHLENLKRIEEQVKSGAQLASQLLGFARRGKYEVKPSDLNQIVERTLGIFERTKKEIHIRRRMQEKIWPAEVDRNQMEQVLLNLYVNAWQAMPEGGTLLLETANVTVEADLLKPFAFQPGNYVRISVTDTGVGMDKETLARIFEPFFTTKEMGRGTGLGLASVYGIVKNHGGFISAYSEPGHGTTFRVYLPASAKPVAKDGKTSGEIRRGKETVLLVDDEGAIVEVMEKALAFSGYTVLTARGGEEAIEVYRKNRERIDLVILDMIMPGMSGGKAFDALRTIDPGVKVILSSGYSIEGEASRIMSRGCDGFIQKPFGIKELSQKIGQVLDKP